MATAALQTPLGTNRGFASAREVGDFQDAVLKTTGGIGAAINVTDVAAIVTDAAAVANVIAAADGSVIGYGLSGQSGVAGAGLNFGTAFGMNVGEYAGYWYEAGGQAAMEAAVALSPSAGITVRLARLDAGEAGGWWKEPITFKALDDGKYSDGTPIRLRLFGDAQKIMNRAFPKVTTPAATPGNPALADWEAGNFNAAEFSYPEADVYAGFFPNNVDDGGGALDEAKLAGSIIASGAKHYYVSAWWQPITTLDFWFNKTWYDALSADDKVRLDNTCRVNAMKGLGLTHHHQGFFVQQFKDHGVTIHPGWPHDVLQALRMATEEILEENQVADATGSLALIQDSMKTHVKAEQVRSKYYPGDLAARWGAGMDLWRSDTPIG